MILHYVLLSLSLWSSDAAAHESADEKRPLLMRCVDPDCSVPISVGRTTVTYPRRGDDFLSFKIDSHVLVLGKAADSVSPLAYAEIANKKGLVPLNLIHEEKIIGKMGLTVPWPLVVKRPSQEEDKLPEETAAEPQPASHVPQEETAGNNRETAATAEQRTENTTGNDQQTTNEPSSGPVHASNESSAYFNPPGASEAHNNGLKIDTASDSSVANTDEDHRKPLPQNPIAGAPLPPTARPHHVPVQPMQSPHVIESAPRVQNSHLGLNSDNLSDATPAHSGAPRPASQNIALSTDPVLSANQSEVVQSASGPDVTPVSATNNNQSSHEIITASPNSADSKEEPAHLRPEIVAESTTTPPQLAEKQLTMPENVTDSAAIEATDVLKVAGQPQNASPPADVSLTDYVSDSTADPVTSNPVTRPSSEPPVGLDAALSGEMIDESSRVDSESLAETGTTATNLLPADESEAAIIGVTFSPFVLDGYRSPVYEVPGPANPEEIDHADITTASPLVDSVTSSTADLFADTTQTVPSNLTDTGSGEREVYEDPVLPPASDSRQAFETVLPMAYVDTIRLYLSCLDILPSSLHDYMDRNNVSPHGVVLTCLIGLLWILLMAVQMTINRNSRHRELEGKIERNASIILRLKSEKSASLQQYAAEREELSQLRRSLNESQQNLVIAENACREAEAQNGHLVSTVNELKEKLLKQEQVSRCLEQEQKRLAKESHEFKSQASKFSADVVTLQKRCQEKEAQVESLTQENDSLVRSQKDLTARQELLQLQKEEWESDMQKLTALKMEQDVRIDELSNETDLLKAQLQEKDILNNALKDLLKDLDAVKNRSDETDWGEGEASESKIEELLELAQIRADQESLLRQKNELEHTLSDVRREKEAVVQELSDSREFVTTSARRVEEAVAAKVEAEKRLEVLERYFNGREVEMQRELGALQVRRQQREEDATSLEKRLQDLEGEKDSYQSQLESMRRELSESERSFKSQLASMEKRAHENWVAARNAEREASDLRRDAVFLRQQLTMMAGSSNTAALSSDGRSDKSVNGSVLDFSSMPLPPPPPPPPPMSMPMSQPHHDYLYASHGYAPLAPEALDLSGSRPESVARDTASVPIDCDGGAAAGGGSSASSLYEFPFIPPPPPPPPSGTFPDPFLMSSMFPHAGYPLPPDASGVWDSMSQLHPTSQPGSHNHPPPSHSSGPPV